MGFWNFFKSKKKDESENDESSHQNISSIDLIFAENFTKSGGRFIFIDEINSTKEVFEKIFEENQWDSENVCSLNANVAKNLTFPYSQLAVINVNQIQVMNSIVFCSDLFWML